jgi:Spy/CpxP family protein refolding chaperone
VRFGCLILAGLLLAGCIDEPELYRPDTAPRQERTVLNALKRVKATDPQRIAVLNVYDATNGKLRGMVDQSRQVVRQWHELNRFAPDFQAQVDVLAAKWAALSADEMKTRATFDHDVAAVLGPKQWGEWQDFMNGEGYEPNAGNEWTGGHRGNSSGPPH